MVTGWATGQAFAEMGVVTEHRVGLERLVEYLLDGERATDGRRHEHVQIAPCAGNLGAQLLEFLQCGEGVDGGVFLAAAQDVAHHRMDGVGPLGEEVTEHHQALGHPRSGIEQFTGRQKRRQRHLDDVDSRGEPVVHQPVPK
jgi:hypothetical protein